MAIAAALVACAGGGTADAPDDGRGDLFGGTRDLGRITWDVPVRGEIRAGFESHRYTFDATERAVVSAEVLRLGSSRDLDTVLYLYELYEYAGDVESRLIAEDDDAGYGGKSKISEFTLPGAATYVLVIGVDPGKGDGRYNLALTCDSGTCNTRPAPDALTEISVPYEVATLFSGALGRDYFREVRAFAYDSALTTDELVDRFEARDRAIEEVTSLVRHKLDPDTVSRSFQGYDLDYVEFVTAIGFSPGSVWRLEGDYVCDSTFYSCLVSTLLFQNASADLVFEVRLIYR